MRVAALSLRLAAVLTALLGCAMAQPGHLVLKFGWAPGFCFEDNQARTGGFCGGRTPFNAFRLNRLYRLSANGTRLGGACTGAAWDQALVPQDLLPELGCVWNSYAEPNNNGALWESLWTEAKESGACTGLTQDVWMRTALELRDTYNVDRILSEAGLSLSTVSTAGLTGLLSGKLGRLPRVQCNNEAVPPQLTSVSLCFATTAPYAIQDCPQQNDACAAQVIQPQGVPVSEQCALYYPFYTPTDAPSTGQPPAPRSPPSQHIPAGSSPTAAKSIGVPIGAFVGGAVGAVVLVAAAVGLCIFLKKRRQRRMEYLDDGLDDPKAFAGTGGEGPCGSGIPAAWGGEPPAGKV